MHALAPTVPGDVRVLLQGLDLQQPPLPAAEAALRSPERLLGDALSLAESVRLGAELNQAARPEPELEPDMPGGAAAGALREQCSELAAARLNGLRRRIDQTYAKAYSAQAGLPDAARMHTMLVDMGALGDNPAARTRVSQMWASSYAQLLTGLVTRMRRDLELFKPELVHKLREQLPATSALLQIDATLDAAIARLMQAALQRLCSAFEARCAARFERAIAALPPECDVASLAALLSARGTATRLLDLSKRLCHALLDLEWSALQGLIDSLSDSGSVEPQEPTAP